MPPGGQIQTSILLKCCTLIDFMICHKMAIHCACKLWTGMIIFRFFFFNFRHIDAPWWPNTEINIPRYISWFATRLQFIVYVNYEQERYDFFQKVQFFENKDGCQSAILDRIGSTQFFCVQMGPMGIHPQTKFGLASLFHYENFPLKRFRLRRTDDGRKVNAIARWSFGPSGLKNRVASHLEIREKSGKYISVKKSGKVREFYKVSLIYLCIYFVNIFTYR